MRKEQIMAICFNESNRTFYLEGKNISYVFRINEYDYVEHLYFGSRIGRDDISYLRTRGADSATATVPGNFDGESYLYFTPELAFYGTGDYREPAVMMQTPAGDRLCELLYISHEILTEKPKMQGMPSMRGGQTLVVHLADKYNGFAADLYYTVYDDCDVAARRVVYKNNSGTPLSLDRAYSFSLGLPEKKYDIMTLHGCWGNERKIETIPLHHGVVSIDSKRSSSSAVLNPFMAMLAPGTTEEHGEAIGVSLVYSSSFVLKAEVTPNDKVLVTGGVNDFDFSWKLEAGECFEVPEVILAYSCEGIGAMSRAFHDAMREHLINPRFVKKHRPIVINNWEATYFKFNNEKLKAIADAVKDTGIDTFVLDDGWFGKRDNDRSGLGDWVVNESKLEGGLKPIIDHVHSLGMKFGLWFEPEMVSEDSDLYRAHPDYAIGVPGRPHCYSRHQFVLDLTRADVRDYIVGAVNKVLLENDIDYVKWDFNRNITEPFSIGRDPDRQKEFAHRYALGLYDICERIIEANPDIFFEGCAGGGARFDPAILYYFPQIWTSDDSDAEERTKIQYGTSIVYPPSSMSCHFAVVPSHQTHRITPARTRAHIAHLGATGYELDTSSFTDEDREMVKNQIAEYHEMEDLVIEGDLYRIENPFEDNHFGFMLVSKDKKRAKLTCYRRLCGANPGFKRFYPAGLVADTVYHIPEFDCTLTGSTLMNAGIVPYFHNEDFRSRTYTFIAKE